MSETIQGNAPVSKFDFLKIEFQFKTQFLDNRVIQNWKKKKKKSKSKFAITGLSKNQVLHLEFYFQKIEFQNRGIFLNSFRHKAFCQKVCEKRVKTHFGPRFCNIMVRVVLELSYYVIYIYFLQCVYYKNILLVQGFILRPYAIIKVKPC